MSSTDAGGAVVLARDAPVSGSYATAGREGPFWSMSLDPAAPKVAPLVAIDDVALTLLDAGGATLDRAAVSLAVQVGVVEVAVAGPVVGSLYVPAALLASRLGAPVLALAYFGVPGSSLPAALLLGATFPERIRGVLANVPTAVAWQGEGPKRGAASGPPTTSWAGSSRASPRPGFPSRRRAASIPPRDT